MTTMDRRVLVWILVSPALLMQEAAQAAPSAASLSDAYALIAFKQEIANDPEGALSDWNVTSAGHACFWNGVRCADFVAYRVASLTLTGMGLEGRISGGLGSLTQLTSLNVSYNALTGPIPSALSSCTLLQVLDLSHNQLNSVIPASLGSLTLLQKVFLGFNQLVGTLAFPATAPLAALTHISVESNLMTGYPFTSFTAINTLVYINLASNSFSGSLDDNDFTHYGTTLKSLLIGSNRFWGKLLTTGLTPLVNLIELDVGNNEFNATIPVEIQTCVKLVSVNMSNNQLTGAIPSGISNLVNLKTLHLQGNNITGGIIAGLLSCKNLTDLRLDNNSLSGTIPAGITSLTRLNNLNLSTNYLTGSIPVGLGNLSLLQSLDLSANLLQGSIPSADITGCVTLTYINMSDNLFNGSVPSEFDGLANLQTLSLAANGLSGPIPASVGNITRLVVLELSRNSLTGSIPSGLENLVYLQQVLLASSGLSGSIPPGLGKVSSLLALDLSGNSLTGPISESLAQQNYAYFDVSKNQLSGKIPDTPAMRYFAPAGFLPGNPKLCAGFIGRDCSSGLSTWEKALLSSLLPGVAMFVAGLLLSSLLAPRGEHYSGKVLRKITDDFNNSNLIGVGGLCTVYKGVFPNGDTVAVKRLRPDYYSDGKKSFDLERKALVKVNHPNIVKVRGSCADGNLMALVTDYMPNGTLDMHLRNMSWNQRMDVAAGVAQAMAYLHGEWQGPQVMRCDLKASSVLLNEDLRARLSDIRLVNPPNPFVSNGASAGAFNGSVGYMPPEYALSGTATTAGDVYSYGVMLLELVTGAKPDSAVVMDGGLAGWVKQAFPDGMEAVADPKLVQSVGCNQQVMMCTQIALQCTETVPADRPTMQEVLEMFENVYSI